MLTIPTQITDLIGTTASVLGDYNILGEDAAGKVVQASQILSGQGAGTTPKVATTVPPQTVSPVSADAKPSLQKAGSLDTKTMMIIGGVGLVVLVLLLN